MAHRVLARPARIIALAAAGLVLLLAACTTDDADPTPAPDAPTESPTPSATATETPSATPVGTSSPSPTGTAPPALEEECGFLYDGAWGVWRVDAGDTLNVRHFGGIGELSDFNWHSTRLVFDTSGEGEPILIAIVFATWTI